MEPFIPAFEKNHTANLLAAFATNCHPPYDWHMPAQTSMNISLPENMRSWVERQIATEGYGTASEYFRALIRSEQARRAREDLDHKLIDSIESGDAVEMTAKDWNMIRATVRERLAAARARR